MVALVETDVLIVGTGPAGGTAALALASYGINHIAITRWGRLVRTPRAHITNQRAMEILRDFGLEDEAKLYATPQELMGNNVFCESLAGEELGRLYSWGNHPRRMADYTLASPTTICDIPQNFMEPILVGNATQRGSTVRYNTQYVSMTQDEDGVTATVMDTVTKQTYDIRAKYLIGADGGNSKVAADAGLTFGGKMGVAGSMNIVFEADLSRYVAHRPSVLYWVLQPGADIGGIGMGLVRMVRPWDKWLIVWGYDINAGEPDLTDEHAIEIVHNLVGDSSIEVKIDSTSVWTVNHCYAENNMTGRVFIAGDAAHRHPPSNGLGSNTSMQDAYNLAWKLAHVLKGHADPSLLESYRDERLPIARQIVDRANKSIEEFGPIFEALGLLSTTDPVQMKANMAKRKENTPEAAVQREALRKAILYKSYEFNAHGVELNQRYVSQAAVTDGAPMPAFERDRELYYQPTTWPGAHLPHTWLRRDEHGENICSTFDLVGKGRFTVLTGIGGEAWVEAAKTITAATGMEIAAYVIGPGRDYQDIYGEWPDLREVNEAGCLLVRPDMFVGWRHADVADNALELLAGALGRLLGKPIPLAAHA
ncbi:MAG: FAD-dependent monooxygenase [Pleurocapsa minor GSE-CHR-MK-17-07R]|nr:FAD-dependent monooxygenase [Pleurocapsa minor GSE-CHR-MK 17-07R]